MPAQCHSDAAGLGLLRQGRGRAGAQLLATGRGARIGDKSEQALLASSQHRPARQHGDRCKRACARLEHRLAAVNLPHADSVRSGCCGPATGPFDCHGCHGSQALRAAVHAPGDGRGLLLRSANERHAALPRLAAALHRNDPKANPRRPTC